MLCLRRFGASSGRGWVRAVRSIMVRFLFKSAASRSTASHSVVGLMYMCMNSDDDESISKLSFVLFGMYLMYISHKVEVRALS